GGRQEGPGGNVGEPLQGKGASLQIAAPRVVGELAKVEPLAPVVTRPPHAAGGLLERGRRSGDVGPAERGERAVAFAKRAVPLGPASLQPEPQARGQPQLGVIWG